MRYVIDIKTSSYRSRGFRRGKKPRLERSCVALLGPSLASAKGTSLRIRELSLFFPPSFSTCSRARFPSTEFEPVANKRAITFSRHAVGKQR